MRILGISAFYHDSAAALLVDGKIVAAAQEERFTRKKHDAGFPTNAIQYCLEEAGITAEDLDYVTFYEKPLLKFDRLLETYLSFAPSGVRSFLAAMPQWLKRKLHLPREIKKKLGGTSGKAFVFPRHHESHAASAFFPSPFESAAILTLDGVGEWECATISNGKGNQTQVLKSLNFPHSLGLLYSAFTYYCGFRVNSGEYKLMGLAPYGKPVYRDLIMDRLLDLKQDGSFRLRMEYFNYCQGLTMTNDRFARLFDGPRRLPESQITEREMNMAASIQKVTEEIVFRMARTAKELTGEKNLCLAGGVALNCVANGKLMREKIFDDIWIQPASGDAGGALGSALLLHYQLLENPRQPSVGDDMKGGRLGPVFSNPDIEVILESHQAVFHRFQSEESLLQKVSSEIASGKVIGWFQDRMEFGPRALGARSIIGDARSSAMQSQMNLRIKYRESFRPFAPSVLREDVSQYFELDGDSPYMLLVANVQKGIQRNLGEEDLAAMLDSDLIKRVNVERSDITAVTHVDMSARVQTVDEERHGRYYRLIREFKKQTDCSVIINTSFNVRGEPIVCSPEDALRCFLATDMDVLVLEDCLLHKAQQPKHLTADRESYLNEFALD
jgi:carbamoyltransferase